MCEIARNIDPAHKDHQPIYFVMKDGDFLRRVSRPTVTPVCCEVSSGINDIFEYWKGSWLDAILQVSPLHSGMRIHIGGLDGVGR
jgi:hypothetical protein